LVPEETIWVKAQGIIKPIFAPVKTYEELRAAVDKCKHPDVKTLNDAFDCWIQHYQPDAAPRKDCVSWRDVYTNYIFMACKLQSLLG
jgi:hypothetical protein